jgi:hypothetical protein
LKPPRLLVRLQNQEFLVRLPLLLGLKHSPSVMPQLPPTEFHAKQVRNRLKRSDFRVRAKASVAMDVQLYQRPFWRLDLSA